MFKVQRQLVNTTL